MKKRILSLVLTLVLAFSLTIPAMALSPEQEAAYKAKIKSEAPKWGSCIQLVDFNLDGSPELVMGGLPGSGLFSIFEDVWSYENGAFGPDDVASRATVIDALWRLEDFSCRSGSWKRMR